MQRYRPLSAHYRERFGTKVYKVSVSTATTCPNRQGLGGMRVCTFCDEWGSAAYADTAPLALAEQIHANRERIRQRYKAERFLVYFQAYTTTFERAARVEDWFETALAEPDVVGVVLGTRPDCLPSRMLRLLARWAERTYVGVELGVQTLDDAQLAWLSRGHTSARSLQALEALRAVPGLDVCAHLMFGLPGETPAQLRETARTLSAAGVDGVKLHNLHVLAGTPLADLHARGEYTPDSLEAYADKVVTFLEYLHPGVAVHRLNAVASRWEQVVAPAWACEKLGPTQFITERMAAWDTWQGRLYEPAQAPPPPPPAGQAATQPGGASWA